MQQDAYGVYSGVLA